MDGTDVDGAAPEPEGPDIGRPPPAQGPGGFYGYLYGTWPGKPIQLADAGGTNGTMTDVPLDLGTAPAQQEEPMPDHDPGRDLRPSDAETRPAEPYPADGIDLRALGEEFRAYKQAMDEGRLVDLKDFPNLGRLGTEASARQLGTDIDFHAKAPEWAHRTGQPPAEQGSPSPQPARPEPTAPAPVPDAKPDAGRPTQPLRRDIGPERGSGIVAKAKGWENTPYASPSSSLKGPGARKGEGGDCSGSVNQIFKEAGHPYPYADSRKFPAAAEKGEIPFREVKPEERRPGDVVVYDKAGHMAVYAGNGDVYSARREGRPFGRLPVGEFSGRPRYYRYQEQQ